MARGRYVVLLDFLVLLPCLAAHDRQELVDLTRVIHVVAGNRGHNIEHRTGRTAPDRSATRVRCPRASGRRRRARRGRTRVCYALKTTPGRWYAAGSVAGALL